MPTATRQRNRRGEGARLREEILAGATVLLERTGSEEAVTLRAIAREIGIAAPSIRPHFATRATIIDAVVAQELAVLRDRLQTASAAHADPADRLFAMARAYVDYGRDHPSRYHVLIGRRFVEEEWASQPMEATAPLMAESIQLVVDAIDACRSAGVSSSEDPFADAVILWFALHGLICVPRAIPSLAWPDETLLLRESVIRAARIVRTAPAGGRSAHRELPAELSSAGR